LRTCRLPHIVEEAGDGGELVLGMKPHVCHPKSGRVASEGSRRSGARARVECHLQPVTDLPPVSGRLSGPTVVTIITRQEARRSGAWVVAIGSPSGIVI
jgi:hypothetical protein